MKKIYSSLFLLLVSCVSMQAQLTLTPFVSAVNKVTDITNVGDDRLFIVEQEGRIRISDLAGNLLPAPFLSITSKVNDNTAEQGLLGLAFSPTYTSDGRFYVNYTDLTGTTVVSRFQVSTGNPDVADSLNEEILFTVSQPYPNHNGGSMHFGPDGYLYIALGDGGAGGDPGNRAQNKQLLLGKILRIDVNTPSGYSIPGSNPYYGSSVANPHIWAVGVRNPWRVSFDKLTGDFWIGDVGQNLWEEINFQPASSAGGENYGWRCYEGVALFDTVGCLPASALTEPVYTYGHFPPCSVTGGYVYRGAQYAAWFGKYFFADYCTGEIQTLTPAGNNTFVQNSLGGATLYEYTTFGQDRYGELYVGKNTSGVLKLSDASCLPTAFIAVEDTITSCTSSYSLKTPFFPGFSYQWFQNGAPLPLASTATYNTSVSGNYHVRVTNGSGCVNFSDTVTLILNPSPNVFFSGLPQIICVNGSSVNLSGTPAGGTFSGAGVTGNSFQPGSAGAGTHIITYTYDAGNGCVIPYDLSVIVDDCLSLAELESNSGITISPNPASGKTIITWDAFKGQPSGLEVLDMKGRVCQKAALSGTTNTFVMDVSGLSKGIYLVNIMQAGSRKIAKLVIQ